MSHTRPVRPQDWRRIRELCSLTGNGGEPIDLSRRPFFEEFWVGPYEKLTPDWAIVAEQDGAVVGYLLACPDSSALVRAKRLSFTPRLLIDVVRRNYDWNSDTKRFVRRTLYPLFHERAPEESFSPEIRERLFREFPAHLHMNVDARFRSSGLGRELVEACFVRLRSQGVPGIHLFCGDKPLAFYSRQGFAEIARLEYRPGVFVYALAARV